MKAYKIKGWYPHFENGEIRRILNPSWMSVPISHSGKGYGRVMRHKDGASIYSAFILMAAAAMTLPVRGVLIDDEKPLTIEDLSIKTRLPDHHFEIAIPYLVEIGWLIEFDYQPGDVVSADDETEMKRRPGRNRATPGQSPAQPVHDTGGKESHHPVETRVFDAKNNDRDSPVPQPGDDRAPPVPRPDYRTGQDRTVQDINNYCSSENCEDVSAEKEAIRTTVEPVETRKVVMDDPSGFEEDPEIDQNARLEILQAIGRAGAAETLSPLHRNQIVQMGQTGKYEDVVAAIESAASAKLPRIGGAFVTYVAKVLASRSFDAKAKPPPPVYTSANPAFVHVDRNRPKGPPPQIPSFANALTTKPIATKPPEGDNTA